MIDVFVRLKSRGLLHLIPGIADGKAVVSLLQHLDIVELVQAYYSFAVANAREEVRKAARFQADSNGNNGVLKVLKQLL